MTNNSNNATIREVSESFLIDLTSGALMPITDAVKTSNGNLILCFRKDYVNIYYKSHSLFKIEEEKDNNRYKLSFDLGHARFISDICAIKNELQNLFSGINIVPSKKKNEAYLAYTSFFYLEKEAPPVPIRAIIEKYQEYIDNFFEIPESGKKERVDYFKDPLGGSTSKTRDLLEKQRQQKIFTDYNKYSSSGIKMVFYDMELSLPGSIESGAPDCLAVVLDNGKVVKIVLVEVKSKKDACEGKHGIRKHFCDFNEIIENDALKKLLYNAMRSALNYYHALGIYPEVKEFCDYNRDMFDMLFLFTDEAIEWTKPNSRRRNKNYEVCQRLISEDLDPTRTWNRIEYLPDIK